MKKNPKKSLDAPQLIFSLGLEKLHVQKQAVGGSCPGQMRDPEQPGRLRLLWPMVSLLLGKRGGSSRVLLKGKRGAEAWACCPFSECR